MIKFKNNNNKYVDSLGINGHKINNQDKKQREQEREIKTSLLGINLKNLI